MCFDAVEQLGRNPEMSTLLSEMMLSQELHIRLILYDCLCSFFRNRRVAILVLLLVQ